MKIKALGIPRKSSSGKILDVSFPYIEFNGEAGSKEKGKLRLEGKEYVVQDGDVMHFLFNV